MTFLQAAVVALVISAASAPVLAQGVGGAGPPAPSLTVTAATGTWKPVAPTSGAGAGLGTGSLSGMGRQAYINSATDFCLFLPPNPVQDDLVQAEADAVAYCINAFNGTRPMPDGFITSAHFRKTDHYVQVVGTFNPAVMNLDVQDCGGEYDNHGAQGVGNPVGAAISGANNFFQFIGSCDIPGQSTFGIRACSGDAGTSYSYCNNRYDLMGLLFVMPDNDIANAGFTNCDATDPLPVGHYPGGSTFQQGDSSTPDASHYPPAPSSSNCQTVSPPTSSGVTYTWNQAAGAVAVATGGSSGSASAAAHTSSPGSGKDSGAAHTHTSGFVTAPAQAVIALSAAGLAFAAFLL
ncbi:hypothetical protein K437DRAFT_255037 [Tilletiaria anomala UBC 951]|uniref:Uncharacterized protein n=1 Tax=Tilletiaria anomala (strain ATCC 24038 / CBS 436.72 / UBC 951) TaxID=1037660 RepID=A0A066WIM9_TILAU|nr:uncharacterized protein K437DRAFT_255037 [Tilletiaria anomala UBC 951]KDN50864.1 hypothetical protein K437DRAFT_255037 [Tilletiaria anomala UBC 951]